MIYARLALEQDEDACVELARLHYAEMLAQYGRPFSEEKTRRTFKNYLKTAAPTVIVAVQGQDVIGLLAATIHDFASTDGHFVTQEIVFVRPDKRGTRASAELVRFYNQWADQLGAIEVYTKLAIDAKLDRNMRFMKRFGFGPVGVTLARFSKGSKNGS